MSDPTPRLATAAETASTETPRERPIIFSGPMVCAILDGRKTQTRRVVKDQPPCGCYYAMNQNGDKALCLFGSHELPGGMGFCPPTPTSKDHRYPCPYGKPGDRLWVRETWASPEANKAQPGRVAYDADGACGAYVGDGGGGLIFVHHGRILEASGYNTCFPEVGDRTFGLGCYTDVRSGKYPSYNYGWRPSIHMPRWASRITLEITGVRVEQLWQITEEDAASEGVGPGFVPNAQGSTTCVGCRPMFVRRWNEINGKRPGCSWADSPWVWAVSFRRIKP